MVVLCLSFFLAFLDQATKFLIRARFVQGDELQVIPGFFSLRYVKNTGAAWGMMAGLNDWLVLLSGLILMVLIVFRRRIVGRRRIHEVCAGLMIAGVVGNLIDRLRLGYVVDFLDFYWGAHHFPAFNVADACICTGVGLYILSQILTRESDGEQRAALCPR